MKRFRLVLCLLTAMVVLVGCSGSKKLTCTHEAEYEGETQKAQSIYTFDKKGEKLSSLTYIQTIGLKDKDDLDEYYEAGQKICDNANEEEGVSCKMSRATGSVTMTTTITMSKLGAEERKELEENGANYDDLKKEYEDKGFTCK